MKRTISTIMTLSALALLLASCGKDPMPGRRGNAPAIKLTVGGVHDTKASVITDKSSHSSYSSDIYDFIETDGFNISAYVTGKWSRDSIGQGPQAYEPGIYIDPGQYEGPYDESTYPTNGNKLKDVLVTYDGSRDNEKWRITGNDGANYADHKFSWISGVAMNFFAYAPVETNGTRSITKADTGTTSIDANYPFTYDAAVTSGVVTSDKCDDLIFAYKQHVATFGTDPDAADFGKTVSGSTDKFDLKFYHALSQIRFCLSTNDDTYDSSLKLVSVKILGPQSSAAGVEPVTFAGLPSAGSCTFTGPSTFSWTPSTASTDKAFYSQTFNADFSGSTPTNWEFGSYTPSGSTESKNLYTCTGDVFFLIPQTISGCNIEVTFQQGTDPAFSMVGKLPDGEWVAGKYYTYKIKASKGLDITLLTSDWYDASSPVNF